MTDETTTAHPAATLMRGLLEASVRYMGRGPQGPPPADPRAANAMAALYAGAAARLLHALWYHQNATDTAAELEDWLKFGEPLADWVGEQATRYGIDVDALIEERLRPSSLPTAPEPSAAPAVEPLGGRSGEDPHSATPDRRVPYKDPQHVLDDIAEYERDEAVGSLVGLARDLLADLEQAYARPAAGAKS